MDFVDELMDVLKEFDATVPPCPVCGAKLYWRAPSPPEPVRVWCEVCGWEQITGDEGAR